MVLFRRFVAGLVAALIVPLGGPFGQPPPQAESSPSSGVSAPEGPSFALQTTTNRSGADNFYIIGEPVYVTLHLTNLSSRPVMTQIRAALQADVRLEVETPFSPRRQVLAPVPSVAIASGVDELYPLETRDYVIKLLYDRQDRPLLSRQINGREEIISWPNLVFDVESYYRIYAQMLFQADSGLSVAVDAAAPAEIRVRAPAPGSAEDLILGELCLRKPLLAAYQQLFAGLKEREFFERAVSDFPNTRFTPSFLYLLARSYTELRGEDLKRSMAHTLRLLREYPDFPGARSATMDLALAYDALEMADKANALVQQLARDDATLIRRSERSPLINKFLGLSRLPYEPRFWMLAP